MNKPIATIDQDAETTEIMAPFALSGSASLAVSLARAEIDQQIATARALPRQLKRVANNILSLATLDEETAEECIYALPRGGKPIRGPSVRLAEIISSQYGNCRVGARVVHVDRFEKFVEAEGVFHDLESNAATTARVRRRIVDSKGRLYNDDMIVVTGNAACAIAKRNAILGAVPKAIWRQTYQAVESVLAGDVKTLVERREAATKAFAAFGVTPDRIFVALGVAGMEEITLDHLATLTGMRSALKSGESTVEEMFPVAKSVGADKAPTREAALDKLAGVDPVTGEIIEPGAASIPQAIGDAPSSPVGDSVARAFPPDAPAPAQGQPQTAKSDPPAPPDAPKKDPAPGASAALKTPAANNDPLADLRAKGEAAAAQGEAALNAWLDNAVSEQQEAALNADGSIRKWVAAAAAADKARPLRGSRG